MLALFRGYIPARWLKSPPHRDGARLVDNRAQRGLEHLPSI